MKNLAIKYGAYLFFGFTGLFLLSHLFGLSDNSWLRVLNGIIHIMTLYYLVKVFRMTHPETVDNYASGTALGVYAGTIGVAAFSVFITLFLAWHPTLLDAIASQMPLGEYLTPVTAGAMILMEGVAVSVIGSYIVTRVIDAQLQHPVVHS